MRQKLPDINLFLIANIPFSVEPIHFEYNWNPYSGGNFVWDRHLQFMQEDEITLVALCLANINTNELTSNELVNPCCPGDFNNKYSIIAFNDNYQYFVYRNPGEKWTTEEDGCDGTSFYCWDFIKVINHCLGRYFGISVDRMNANIVMGEVPNDIPIRGELTECDIQKLRYLYCDSPLNVRESRSIKEISLNIYPNPSKKDQILMSFNNPKNQIINVELTDINGNKISGLTNYFLKGNNSINYPTENLPSGSYIISLNTENYIYSSKIILEK